MLRIYRNQMSTFQANAVERFTARMVEHLGRFFPREAAALGDAALRALIADGIEEAARHGITTRRETCKYLTLLVAFGRGFDRLPWASAVLSDPEITSAPQRMARLYEAGIAAADTGAG